MSIHHRPFSWIASGWLVVFALTLSCNVDFHLVQTGPIDTAHLVTSSHNTLKHGGNTIVLRRYPHIIQTTALTCALEHLSMWAIVLSIHHPPGYCTFSMFKNVKILDFPKLPIPVSRNVNFQNLQKKKTFSKFAQFSQYPQFHNLLNFHFCQCFHNCPNFTIS